MNLRLNLRLNPADVQNKKEFSSAPITFNCPTLPRIKIKLLLTCVQNAASQCREASQRQRNAARRDEETQLEMNQSQTRQRQAAFRDRHGHEVLDEWNRRYANQTSTQRAAYIQRNSENRMSTPTSQQTAARAQRLAIMTPLQRHPSLSPIPSPTNSESTENLHEPMQNGDDPDDEDPHDEDDSDDSDDEVIPPNQPQVPVMGQPVLLHDNDNVEHYNQSQMYYLITEGQWNEGKNNTGKSPRSYANATTPEFQICCAGVLRLRQSRTIGSIGS